MSPDRTPAVLANYPFLHEAKEYIRDKGPDPESLLKGWGEMKNRALERVIQSLKNGKVANRSYNDLIDIEDELFSYPVARLLVSCVEDNYLVRRYALAEAERVAERMKTEDMDTVLDIGGSLGVPAEEGSGGVFVHFIDYLENTSGLRASEWKLVNQDLRDGRVLLSLNSYRRLLKERVMQEVLEGLPVTVTDPDLLSHFRDYITKITSTLEEFREGAEFTDMGHVEPELFPPCIKHMLSEMREGINLSHDARFSLTAFLHKIGLDKEGILNLFHESPDFREDLALYQIEHIIGDISGTEYTPPGCDLMITVGICYSPDNLCKREWMKHPLTYYSVKKREG